MIDRTPLPREQRPALPAFDPVPRQRNRHDGWTPERQRAFIEALADTGSVATAARMVNMSTESAYMLRRHPQAGSFAAAWEAATNMGWCRLKDEAFERALNGQLVPVFTAGKLIGYRRKKNDRLLMFILRHYGPEGPAPTARPLTVNVFNATARINKLSLPLAGESWGDGAKHSELAPPAQQSTPNHQPVSREVETSPPDPRDVIATFAGVPLDDEAQAQILAALTANATRQRNLPIEEDPNVPFIHTADAPAGYLGEMQGGVTSDDEPERKPGEVSWQMLGDEETLAQIDAAVEAVKAA